MQEMSDLQGYWLHSPGLEVSVGFFPSAILDRSSTGFTSLLAALIVKQVQLSIVDHLDLVEPISTLEICKQGHH